MLNNTIYIRNVQSVENEKIYGLSVEKAKF